MDVSLTISGEDAADLTRDLYSWLSEETDLRGYVLLHEGRIPEGTLGSSPDILQLVLGAGGAGATAASVLIAWLRNRTGEVSVKLTQDDRTVEVTAKGIRHLDAAEVHQLARKIAELLDSADDSR